MKKLAVSVTLYKTRVARAVFNPSCEPIPDERSHWLWNKKATTDMLYKSDARFYFSCAATPVLRIDTRACGTGPFIHHANRTVPNADNLYYVAARICQLLVVTPKGIFLSMQPRYLASRYARVWRSGLR